MPDTPEASYLQTTRNVYREAAMSPEVGLCFNHHAGAAVADAVRVSTSTFSLIDPT